MADLNIDTTDITAALRKNLDGYTPDLSVTQVGRVLEVGDGIARVSGLPDCAVNELLEFDGRHRRPRPEPGRGVHRRRHPG